MTGRDQATVKCQVCKKQKKLSEVLSAELIREPIVNKIRRIYPD